MPIDTPLRLTLQVFETGRWQDAMTLDFAEPQKGFDSPCRFGYESDYLVSHYEQIETLFASGLPEVTLNHPQIGLRDLDQRLKTWGLR